MIRGCPILSDEEWLAFGNETKRIRDNIILAKALMWARFRLSDRESTLLVRLDNVFLRIRSALDTAVCAAHSMSVSKLVDGTSLTQVFFGPINGHEFVIPKYVIFKPRPRRLDASDKQSVMQLISDICAFIASPNVVAFAKPIDRDAIMKLIDKLKLCEL